MSTSWGGGSAHAYSKRTSKGIDKKRNSGIVIHQGIGGTKRLVTGAIDFLSTKMM